MQIDECAQYLSTPLLDDLHLHTLQSLCVVLQCAAGDYLRSEGYEVLVALLLPHVVEVDDVRVVESAEDAGLHSYPPLLSLRQPLHVDGVPRHLLARLCVVCEVDGFVGASAEPLIEANVAAVGRRLHLVEGSGVTGHDGEEHERETRRRWTGKRMGGEKWAGELDGEVGSQKHHRPAEW